MHTHWMSLDAAGLWYTKWYLQHSNRICRMIRRSGLGHPVGLPLAVDAYWKLYNTAPINDICHREGAFKHDSTLSLSLSLSLSLAYTCANSDDASKSLQNLLTTVEMARATLLRTIVIVILYNVPTVWEGAMYWNVIEQVIDSIHIHGDNIKYIYLYI